MKEYLAEYAGLVLTPWVLAETSSLALQIGDPARSDVRAAIKAIVDANRESWKSAKQGVAHPNYLKLGLTDAMLCLLAEDNATNGTVTLLTDDFTLCQIAQRRGCRAVNFTHIRDASSG